MLRVSGISHIRVSMGISTRLACVYDTLTGINWIAFSLIERRAGTETSP
jgi:hypothetical protein